MSRIFEEPETNVSSVSRRELFGLPCFRNLSGRNSSIGQQNRQNTFNTANDRLPRRLPTDEDGGYHEPLQSGDPDPGNDSNDDEVIPYSSDRSRRPARRDLSFRRPNGDPSDDGGWNGNGKGDNHHKRQGDYTNNQTRTSELHFDLELKQSDVPA
ncbi:hypothetical protein M422DRAFT_45692 [Sphaerobolus stellatus SS14]|nr:hypothetical protein M422DRAFT_45692 [Sphaerobolus stellatus SS14]